MQRSITHKEPLSKIAYIFIFAIYESLSTIYLFLPPLFGVLFFLFHDAIKKEDSLFLIFVAICMVLFEANKGYTAFSTILYFVLAHKFIMPRIIQNFNCSSCIKISYVFFAYTGYYLFSMILSSIFLTSLPEFNYYIIYYIVIEFFIVSIL
jgi:hypothetical protein